MSTAALPRPPGLAILAATRAPVDEDAALVLSVVIVAAIAAAAVAVVGRPGRAPAALVVLAAALALALILYAATGAALAGLAALAGAAMIVRVAWTEDDGEAAPATRRSLFTWFTASRPEGFKPDWPRRLAAVGLLAGLAFVLVGTWARQFVWTGRPLPPGFDPGATPALAAALADTPAPAVLALVGLIVAAACAGPPRHRI